MYNRQNCLVTLFWLSRFIINKEHMKKLAAGLAVAGLAFASLAFAASPVDPNCPGTDASNFARNGASGVFDAGSGFGQFHAYVAQLPGEPGVGDAILAHLQGLAPISTCPDYGFPTPLH